MWLAAAISYELVSKIQEQQKFSIDDACILTFLYMLSLNLVPVIYFFELLLHVLLL